MKAKEANKKNKDTLANVLKMLLIIVLASILAYGFQQFDFRSENILLVYLVANLLVVLETRKLLYGIISGVLCAVVYDFIFIKPNFSFMMDDKSYLISLVIYLAVCLVISLMSYRLQMQIKKVESNDLLVKSTYENSKSLLKLKSPEDIANYEVKYLSNLLKRKVIIGLKKRKNFVLFGDKNFSIKNSTEIFNYAINYNLICGHNEQKYSELNYKIYPLKTSKTNFGVLVVECLKGDLKKQEKEFVKTNITHILMALEREKIQDQKEDVKEKIEIEKLKNALVLNVSNDIKDPIKLVNDKCMWIMENYDALSDETVVNALFEIREQNSKLNEYVDYLFNIATLDSGEEVKNEKVVDINNVIENALSRFNGDFMGHKVNVDCVNAKVSVDPELMADVFENIITNAIKYTENGSILNIRGVEDDSDVVLEFEDNGKGVEDKQIDSIFEPKQLSEDGSNYKIGLSVCKKIVEAHNGKIKAFNNALGGLTIKISLKIEK